MSMSVADQKKQIKVTKKNIKELKNSILKEENKIIRKEKKAAKEIMKAEEKEKKQQIKLEKKVAKQIIKAIEKAKKQQIKAEKKAAKNIIEQIVQEQVVQEQQIIDQFNNCPDSELSQLRRQLAKKHHPDRNQNSGEIMKVINQLYDKTQEDIKENINEVQLNNDYLFDNYGVPIEQFKVEDSESEEEEEIISEEDQLEIQRQKLRQLMLDNNLNGENYYSMYDNIETLITDTDIQEFQQQIQEKIISEIELQEEQIISEQIQPEIELQEEEIQPEIELQEEEIQPEIELQEEEDYFSQPKKLSKTEQKKLDKQEEEILTDLFQNKIPKIPKSKSKFTYGYEEEINRYKQQQFQNLEYRPQWLIDKQNAEKKEIKDNIKAIKDRKKKVEIQYKSIEQFKQNFIDNKSEINSNFPKQGLIHQFDKLSKNVQIMLLNILDHLQIDFQIYNNSIYSDMYIVIRMIDEFMLLLRQTVSNLYETKQQAVLASHISCKFTPRFLYPETYDEKKCNNKYLYHHQERLDIQRIQSGLREYMKRKKTFN